MSDYGGGYYGYVDVEAAVTGANYSMHGNYDVEQLTSPQAQEDDTLPTVTVTAPAIPANETSIDEDLANELTTHLAITGAEVAVGVAEGMEAGAAAGALAGPVGALIGLAVGAAIAYYLISHP